MARMGLVEAIEAEFVPLLIHNNKPGKDAEVLKRFAEPEDFVGRHVTEVLPPELAADLTRLFDRVARTDEPGTLEYFVPVAREIRRLAKLHGVTGRVHFVRGGKLAALLNHALDAWGPADAVALIDAAADVALVLDSAGGRLWRIDSALNTMAAIAEETSRQSTIVASASEGITLIRYPA